MSRPVIFTKASEIAVELSARLATIKVADGFHTDIGLRVYRGRRKIDDEMIPCAVLFEGADDVSNPPGHPIEVKVDQGYVLGGYAKCDPDNPNDTAHLIIKDLKRAVFGGAATLGGKVRVVQYNGRDIGPRADGVAIVFAVIEIEVEYAETLLDP